MKLTRFAPAAAVLAAGALTLSACGTSSDAGDNGDANGSGGSDDTAQVSGNLIGGGASSQEAAMTAWTDGVTGEYPDLTVQYDPVGSGSGREGFLNGQYSFAGSDAAMDEEELEASQQVCGADGAFHVPAYISPVAVAYNLPGVAGAVQMDADTIAQVFMGEITTWNDEAIASQNEDLELPDTAITVVHRADDSGTTENFTEYLDAAADSWSFGPVEAWPSDIAAESAQQTSGVVSLVQSTEGAITYADASQIGDLGTVAVGVGDSYVEYSADAAAMAVDAAGEGLAGAVELERDTEEEGVYPIVLVAYSIFCHTYQDDATADMARAFGSYIVSEEGQATAEAAAGNAPISEDTRARALEAIEAISAQG